MKFYEAGGTYYARRSDIPKGVKPKTLEIPTDKESVLALLNYRKPAPNWVRDDLCSGAHWNEHGTATVTCEERIEELERELEALRGRA